MTSIILCALAVVFFAGGVDLYRRTRALEDLKSYGMFMGRYYDAAMKLVDVDETPDELIELIDFLSEEIADPHAAPRLAALLRQGKLSSRPTGETTRRISEIHKFFETRRELKPIFVELASSAILAISFKSMIWGGLIRTRLSAVDTIERKEEILFEYRRGNCLVPA